MRRITRTQEAVGVISMLIVVAAVMATAGVPAGITAALVGLGILMLVLGTAIRHVDERDGRVPAGGLRLLGTYGIFGAAYWAVRRQRLRGR